MNKLCNIYENNLFVKVFNKKLHVNYCVEEIRMINDI